MTTISNSALPNESVDLVAEMRRRLSEKGNGSAAASLVRKAPTPQNQLPPSPAQAAAAAATVAPMPAVATPQPQTSAPVQRSSESIFDPFSSAASPAPTPVVAVSIAPPLPTPEMQIAVPVPASTPAAAAPTIDQIAVAEIAQPAATPAPPVAAAAPVTAPIVKATTTPPRYSLGVYASVCAIAAMLGVYTVYNGNQQFAGEMYGYNQMATAAEAFVNGKNYATFDLNINIRQLRDQHLARMTKTPDVILLGASHWQEANEELVTNQDMYNSHIHRDYWEDLFAMINILERNDKLPKKLIISIRDNQFMGIPDRRDFLWEPGIPYWREQAAKMGIPTEPFWESYSWQRLRERLSLSLLINNITRWYKASEYPRVTDKDKFKALDVLLPGGSIKWSRQHDAFFTPERSRRESLTFAEFKKRNPPKVEMRGVENFEKLLDYLQGKGVTVYIAHPPFNPIYWDAVQNSRYSEILTKYKALIDGIANARGIQIVGSFNPYEVGCTAEQYIDAEHANSSCLANIFNQWMALDAKATQPASAPASTKPEIKAD